MALVLGGPRERQVVEVVEVLEVRTERGMPGQDRTCRMGPLERRGELAMPKRKKEPDVMEEEEEEEQEPEG